MPGLPHMAAAYPRATNTMPQALPAQPQQQQTTTEMAIPNDLIGCIIGRGGQKINEIRYSHSDSVWNMNSLGVGARISIIFCSWECIQSFNTSYIEILNIINMLKWIGILTFISLCIFTSVRFNIFSFFLLCPIQF